MRTLYIYFSPLTQFCEHSLNTLQTLSTKLVFAESKPVFAKTKLVFTESKLVFTESKLVFTESKLVFAESKLVFNVCQTTSKQKNQNTKIKNILPPPQYFEKQTSL